MLQSIGRKHLDQKLAKFKPVNEFQPPAKGWIRAIRNALGMTAQQLALRLNVSQPRISAIEKEELSGALTLDTIRRTADALDCTFVYALVPRTSLEDAVNVQANKKRSEQLARINHTMMLESQEVNLQPESVNVKLKGLWADDTR